MDPCLGIWGSKMGPMFRDFFVKNRRTHLGGTSPYSVSMEVPPPGRAVTFLNIAGHGRSPVSITSSSYISSRACTTLPMTKPYVVHEVQRQDEVHQLYSYTYCLISDLDIVGTGYPCNVLVLEGKI